MVRLEPVDGATIADAPCRARPRSTTDDDVDGRCAVPNLASFFQARSLGLTPITPAVTVPFGFETAQAATRDRAYVLVDEHRVGRRTTAARRATAAR